MTESPDQAPIERESKNDKWARLNVIWTRRNITATVFVGILTATVSIAIFALDSKDEEVPTKTVESPSAAKTSPTVSVSALHVSAVAMDIPAVFELAIQAGGVSGIPIRNMNIVLDFGRAEIETCGYRPKQSVTGIVGEDKSYRRLEVAKLPQKEELHIRCFISSPYFREITINGDNLFRSHSIDFDHYRDSIIGTEESFWVKFFRVIVVVITGGLVLRFLGWLFARA